MVQSVRKLVYADTSRIPGNEIGLLLGADLILPDGSTNLHFVARTKAAADLYLAGKIKRVLISGNKNNKGYNEPLGMKLAVLQLGVPESAVILDFDGFRTLQSVIRARDVFQCRQVTVITDRFHIYRALFLCKHNQIDAVGYCASPTRFDRWAWRAELREFAARVKALADVLASSKQPG